MINVWEATRELIPAIVIAVILSGMYATWFESRLNNTTKRKRLQKWILIAASLLLGWYAIKLSKNFEFDTTYLWYTTPLLVVLTGVLLLILRATRKKKRRRKVDLQSDTQDAATENEGSSTINISFGWLFATAALLVGIGLFLFWDRIRPPAQLNATARGNSAATQLTRIATGVDDVLTAICDTESAGQGQFEKDGVTPLHGRIDPDDIGYCQINQRVWKDEIAAHPELDIYNKKEDNFQFARMLYGKYGGGPWARSAYLWWAKVKTPVFLIMYARTVGLDESDLIRIPKGSKYALEGNGRKYTVRFNESADVDMPRTAESVQVPDPVSSIRIRSREGGNVEVMLTLRPSS